MESSDFKLKIVNFRIGEQMKSRAAIAWEAKKPLEIDEIEIQGPAEGEVLVKLTATGVCHTDAYTLSGKDPEGIFPSILGHEGAGEVVELGKGVSSLKVGDHVIPLYVPECQKCKFCLSGKTNLCQAVRATQGKGLMPDGTSRFSYKGKKIFHYMGTSTFSEYTIVPEIALANIAKKAPLDKVCLLGCGISTGIGAVLNTAKVEAGSTVAVFGLGGVGLSVIQGAVMAKAKRIIEVANSVNAPFEGVVLNHVEAQSLGFCVEEQAGDVRLVADFVHKCGCEWIALTQGCVSPVPVDTGFFLGS